MPTYDYACEMGHTLTVEQRITDTPLRTCQQATPHGLCGGRLKRLIPVGTVPIFKGGGWTPRGNTTQ